MHIVRDYDTSTSASFPRNVSAKVTIEKSQGESSQRFSMVESSEYDSD